MYISKVKCVEFRICSFDENSINPFMLNGISRRYQLEQSISVLRDVRWYFFHFYSNFNRKLCKQTVETPHQTLRSVASDLGLYYLPMSHKKDTRHIWVKNEIVFLIS